MTAPSRKCLACGVLEPIGEGEPIWPHGWTCRACGRSVEERDGIPMFAPELAGTVSGFDPDSFGMLANVEQDHFWFVARNKLIVGLVRKFFPDARRFLEVGCGNGAVLKAVAGDRSWERLVGSELQPNGLAFARERLPRNVEFVQMDAREIPAVDAFDLTGAFDVIEHIPDDEAVLRGLRGATQTGGGIIVAVPQHPWLWSSADDMAHHQRRYRRNELEDKLRRSGFEVLFSSSFTTLLLPLMVISRRKAKTGNSEERVDREFAIPPFLNGLLKAALSAEVGMTLAGVTWPVGGSRVVVARAI